MDFREMHDFETRNMTEVHPEGKLIDAALVVALAAAGRADERGDLLGGNLQAHVFERLQLPVVQIEVCNFKLIHIVLSYFISF